MLVANGMNIVGMEQKTCEICFEDKNSDVFKTLSCCKHDASCTDCLCEIINTSLQAKTVANIQCPNRHCAQPINSQDIDAINPNLSELFCDIAAQEYVNNEKHIKHCPTPECPYSFINDQKVKAAFKCPSCKHVYCSECRVQHAPEMTCEQAHEHKQLIGDTNKRETANTEWLQNNTKACPQCKTSVEKNKGCNHMTCKCSHQFCWLCLAGWRTCSCPHFTNDQLPQGQPVVNLDNALFLAGADINIQEGGDIVIHGNLQAEGNIMIQGGDINIRGLIQGGDINLQAGAINIDPWLIANAVAQLLAHGAINIQAPQVINNGQIVIENNQGLDLPVRNILEELAQDADLNVEDIFGEMEMVD